MDRTERFHRIDQLLQLRGGVSRDRLMRELQVSLATLKRDLAYMRGRFNAPIEFDRDLGSYRFGQAGAGPKYELPGLWFSASETHALLSMHQLLSELEPGLLAPHIAPLLSRLEAIVCREGEEFADISKRIRLARIGMRRKNPEHFATVSRATIERQRLTVRHYNRAENRHTERVLSPQRLTFYRNNWYLEAWCHTREDLRRFSIDALEAAAILPAKAKTIAARQLDEAFGTSYGIYAGKASARARLRFTPAAARWVAEEEWHSEQVGRFNADGSYELEVPYGEPTELVMDILRHGPNVTVLKPASLRQQVAARLREAAALYPESRTGNAEAA